MKKEKKIVALHDHKEGEEKKIDYLCVLHYSYKMGDEVPESR
jgi:hypothetical protein